MTDSTEPKEVNIKEWVLQVFQRIEALSDARLKRIEEQSKISERQLAALTQGYGEMAAMIQSIMAVSLKDVDAKAFQEAYEANMKTMVEVIGDGLRQARASQPKFYPGHPQPPDDSSDTDPEAEVPDL